MHPRDRSVRTLFGDAGAATWVGTNDADAPSIGPFVYGTDGSGANNLIVQAGGLRQPGVLSPTRCNDSEPGPSHLRMNGPEIFDFTLKAVPSVVLQLAAKAEVDINEIDFFVFHQANQFMLEQLRKKMKIPRDKFFVGMRCSGNTVSSTIPIALKDAADQGLIKVGALIMLVGFGVGYSWGGTLVRWQ